MKKTIKISDSEKEKLWGVSGPYSQASLIIQTRILDDRISRVFLEVEVAINPLTFEFVKTHRQQFANDSKIQQLLDHSEYRGLAHGYISCAYSQEYDQSLLKEANKHLKSAEQTIIKMHKFVMKYLNPEVN